MYKAAAMKRTVLITGGAGFIGSRTATALLADGHRVRVLDNLEPQIHGESPRLDLPADVELVRGDVRDPAAVAGVLDGVDTVVHLAALTSVSQSMSEIRRQTDTNALGTATLWDVIVNQRFPVERVILGSSRAVYGEGAAHCPTCAAIVSPLPRRPERLASGEWQPACPRCGGATTPAPTSEIHEPRPVSVYGHLKLLQENLSHTVANAYSIRLAILRYFNVYGPGQPPSNPYTGIVPTFCARLRAGKPIVIYEDGLMTRDFVHVDDVVAANRMALDGVFDSGAVNIGSGQSVTILELARRLTQLAGEVERFEFSRAYRQGDIRAGVGDISLATQRGFRPSIGLEEGLAGVLSWLDECGAGEHYDESVRWLATRGLIGRATL
jgi:dTDP-L-rhamnose 4-epimerase